MVTDDWSLINVVNNIVRTRMMGFVSIWGNQVRGLVKTCAFIFTQSFNKKNGCFNLFVLYLYLCACSDRGSYHYGRFSVFDCVLFLCCLARHSKKRSCKLSSKRLCLSVYPCE